MSQIKGSILIIDDNEKILSSLRMILQNEFAKVTTLKNPNLISGLIQKESFDVIVLDMNFSAGVNSGNEGVFWLNEIIKIDSEAIVVMITAYGDIDLAVKAMKVGATDFILKPWDNQKLIATLKSALKLRLSKLEVKNLKKKEKYLSEHIETQYRKIIGSSPVMQQVMTTINKIASTEANVLILGENGTGKELIAREIHYRSTRKDELFVTLDMASLSESLFEGELFGYKKGAFTDAKEDRIGRIESASGGTLFLDEIGNLNMSLQSKLLTVLQNREIFPIGSINPVPIDIRLISATNLDVAKMITEGRFREDLFYRINTITIEAPPLRKRGEDIIMLAEHFLTIFSRKYGRQTPRISKQAAEKLLKYSWPGNVRELEHIVEKAVILTEGNTLQPNDFSFLSMVSEINTTNDSLNLEDVEKATIDKALKLANGNISQAAETLGISRKTLYIKINKYGL
ncbi:MAG: sigma-54-dependent transcriptional regulator [Tenuifilaceae bacterium]